MSNKRGARLAHERDAVRVAEDMNSAYHRVLRRAFRIAGETGELCRPVHLLAALAEAGGPISDALRPPDGSPLFRHPAGPTPDRGGGASYLVMQAQQAARRLASERGEAARPGHLFLAVIDQAEPEAIALLGNAGLELGSLRSTALDILGAPADLEPVPMPELIPAGTMDRPPLPISRLDPAAWAAACWRQEHLPLRRLQRPSHYEALRHLESQASWRIAARRGLDDDQRYSLARHHLDRVEQLAAHAKPDLVDRRELQARFPIATTVSGPPHPWRRRRRQWLGFTVGWGTWFSNRRVGLRDRWFRVLTAIDYRDAPQL